MKTDHYTAFSGSRLVATGPLREVLLAAQHAGPDGLLIFDDDAGRQHDFNLHGSPEQMLARELPEPRPRGPGRPKLGVVSREVSLLPRHWDWLEQEPSGSSAALRRLVEAAIKQTPTRERVRVAREAALRVMTVLAGNLVDFEEATRALYGGDARRFRSLVRRWPKDVRAYVERMTEATFLSPT